MPPVLRGGRPKRIGASWPASAGKLLRVSFNRVCSSIGQQLAAVNAWDIVGFVVLSVIIFGLQHGKVIFSDDYSFKRRSVEVAVIALVVGAIVVLVELLW